MAALLLFAATQAEAQFTGTESILPEIAVRGQGWAQLRDLAEVKEFVLAFIETTVMISVLAYHPVSLATRKIKSDFEAPKSLFIYALIGMVVYADPSEAAGAFTAAGYNRFDDGAAPATLGVTLDPGAYQAVTLKNRTETNDVWVATAVENGVEGGWQGAGVYQSLDIDGDGWRNVSLVKGYRKDQIYSSRVVLEEAIAPYPDLPITVGPIAADLDPEWSGDPEAQQIAREIFALPQVEVGHHTYSHPFEWGFFEEYTTLKEAPFATLYKHLDRTAWSEEVLESDAAKPSGLLADAYDHFGAVPTLLERDFNFPPMDELLGEVRRIKTMQLEAKPAEAANG